jgi:hypothetical protein
LIWMLLWLSWIPSGRQPAANWVFSKLNRN